MDLKYTISIFFGKTPFYLLFKGCFLLSQRLSAHNLNSLILRDLLALLFLPHYVISRVQNKILWIQSGGLGRNFHETVPPKVQVKAKVIKASLKKSCTFQLTLVCSFFIFMGGMQVVGHLRGASVYSLPPVPLNVILYWLQPQSVQSTAAPSASSTSSTMVIY